MVPSNRKWLRVVLCGVNEDVADQLVATTGLNDVFQEKLGGRLGWADIWPAAEGVLKARGVEAVGSQQQAGWQTISGRLEGAPQARILAAAAFVMGLGR
jgi:hypothetical protein